MVCTPWGEMLSFKVADLSVMPLPEKDRISGNFSCKAASKFEASTTVNSSSMPAAFGIEMIADLFVACLPTTDNNTC